MLLTREQLQERLIALHRASLELVKDVSLEHLLERIATLACSHARVAIRSNRCSSETSLTSSKLARCKAIRRSCNCSRVRSIPKTPRSNYIPQNLIGFGRHAQ